MQRGRAAEDRRRPVARIVVPKGYRVGLSIRGKDYVYPGPSGGKL